MTAFTAGFGLGLSLIIVIGAQNAFVLRQGLNRAHVFAVCLVCALSDAILIIAGVSGFHYLIDAFPRLEAAARYGGAAFLAAYGARSFWVAARASQTLQAAERAKGKLAAAVATCLALTWLNPHVYLDTVVLLGSVSTQYPGARPAFAAGAVGASFAFFFGLGYGARVLTPLFSRPVAWKILDAIIGAVMWSVAASLLIGS
ncbi:MAG: LysE/ArgO family amino acid transporter [Gammaproteobacteria bacterium]|nr:LysE/ArgO family amino acid transporter [Gammaproteobacteria bacterium]MDD9883689.1 LysE/ArgO family amino acid transporter [Gammaproteobacteria bacterium]